MKGGLVSALYAARAVADSGVQLPGDLLVATVVGEEDGGLGTLACCNAAGAQTRASSPNRPASIWCRPTPVRSPSVSWCGEGRLMHRDVAWE